MAMRNVVRVLTLTTLALTGLVAGDASGHQKFDHNPPPLTPQPAPSKEFMSGGPGAKWEYVTSITTGNPHSDLDFFTQKGETFASVGTLALGTNGGGQTIVQLTDKGEVKPKFVSTSPTASCLSNPAAATGLQHDVEATPKGESMLNSFNPFAVRSDTQLLLDTSDQRGRCHDQGTLGLQGAPRGGIEILDVTDVTKPTTIGLVSHAAEAHTVNVDPKRPQIAYAVTSSQVTLDESGIRRNETPGGAERFELDGFEVMDLSSCMNFPAGTSADTKRAACRPQVYRYRYPSTSIARGHTNRSNVFGCHELEIYPNDKLTCGGGTALINLDMREAFDDRGTPDDYTDDRLRGKPLPCTVRDSTSMGPFFTRAKVTDCVNGAGGPDSLDIPTWLRSGAPSLEGVRYLGSVFHQGGTPQDAQPRFNATQDVLFNHESEMSASGNLLLATDERGGGIVPPGASCTQGADNINGNGGVSFYRADRLLQASPSDPEAAFGSYARTPEGRKAIFRAGVRTGAQATVCTAHLMQQIPGQNRVFMAWYSQGTQVIDFTENPDGTVSLKEAGFFLPINTDQWVSSIFKAQQNPDGTFTYFGATGDFNLGERGRNTIDVYKVTLPPPPKPADGPGVVGRDGAKTVTVADPSAPGGRRQVDVSPSSGAPACTAVAAIRSASVRSNGPRATFAFSARGPVTIDLFRQSAGSRVTGERLVRRFAGVRRAVRFNGRDRRGRKLGDGYYVARFAARAPSGATEYRRLALLRRNGRFVRLPAYSGQDTCALVRTFKLERPVFGGRSNRALNIAFRLGDEARATVTIARTGGQVVKSFPLRAYRGGQTHRLRLTAKASRFPRGRYTVTLTARDASGTTTSRRLTAFRL